MKYSIIFSIMLASLFGTARADIITVGNGTVQSAFPFYTFYMDADSYFLYLNSEIIAAGGGTGIIKAIGFEATGVIATQPMSGFKIYLQNTTLTTVTGRIADGWTLVYSVGSYTAQAGWNMFQLQTDFDYNSAQNLLVKVCFNNSSWTSSTNVLGTTLTGRAWCGYSDLSADDGCTYNWTFGQTPALPNIRMDIEMNPTIVGVYPQNGAVLQTNMIYSTPPHKPGIDVKRTAAQPATRVYYEIVGPLPSTNVIYRAHVAGVPSNEWINLSGIGEPFNHRFTTAKFAAARQIPSNDGALDLITNSIGGGEYQINAKLRLQPPGDPTYEKTYTSKFIIALANDLAVTNISEPRQKHIKKYPSGQIPIRFDVRNVGLNPVTEFKAYVRIWRGGSLVYIDSVHRVFPQTLSNPLTTGQGITIEQGLRQFVASVNGDYTMQVCCQLLSATDQGPENDCVPHAGDTYTFTVAYDQEPQADSLYVPKQGDILYVGTPVRPLARFSNNGITDVSDVPVRLTITNIDTGVEVWNQSYIAQDIPAGITNNFAIVMWNNAFIPQEPGNYRACARVEFPGDPVLTNNEVCVTFTVQTALSGIYTIGTLNLGNPRNFPTIKDALDRLFKLGVSGPTTFELTDAEYNEGSAFAEYPALDFRSRITGASAQNPILFRPSNARSILRGGVRVNLHSAIGIGMMFGQSQRPNNSNAPVLIVQPSLVRQFANSEGHITWDGGNSKAFLFTLNTPISYRAVFYMSSAKNITIKNSLITDGLNQPVSTTCTLPNNMFNPSLFQFYFENDFSISPARSYSAGVVIRSVPPIEEKFSSNYFHMDTINTNNIRILDNEITNFSYGVVSMGIGVLIYQSQAFTGFQRYYNHDNLIKGNVLSSLSRAGVFVGFEQNTRIENNRIFNIQGTCGADAAGIIAGGDDRLGMWSYGNIGLTINGNEISNVTHANNVYGIKVLQGRVQLNDPTRGVVNFPDLADNNKITNNIVWGLNSPNAATNRYGIRLYTKRNGAFDVPLDMKQFTINDRIVNNTIIIDNDNHVNTGNLAAIALQQTKNTFMMNNAIAFMDENVGTTDVATAMLYHGMTPEESNSIFNRNVYWLTNGTQASMFRFIYTSDTSTVIDYGTRTDFIRLDQWQNWTGMEYHSAVGNFMNDMVYVGSNPPNLRVRLTPLPPKSSILNNRGDRLDEVTHDIDGRVRGVANQRYDIGAVEFDGRFYTSDLEMMGFAAPGSYRENFGLFNDAEYIMTKAPVGVKARIRNNGNIQQNDVNVNLKIYRETPAEFGQVNFVGTLEKSKTMKVSISSTEDVELDFLLDNEGGLNDDWTPQTYSDLRGTGYTVPAHFKSMQPNVTPRYRIEVSLDPNVDEVLTNNTITKVVRFYLKRSSLSILLSTENSHIDINDNISKLPLASMNDLDKIAGRLNVDTLIAGFKRIGWEIDYNLEHPRYEIDIFERNGWEPKNVNYTMYRTLIWSDASDKAITRFQMLNLDEFLTTGASDNKKNLIIGSQEFVRMNQTTYDNFMKNRIRTVYDTRGGANVPFNPILDVNQRLVGVALARQLETNILNTGWDNMTTQDASPSVVYHNLFQTNEGLSRIGFFYKLPTNQPQNNKIMSVATTTLGKNVITLGLDWRHFGNVEFVLRSIIDYIETNGGTIIPVNLLSFDAQPVGSRVELSWATASEQNASRFDIERAQFNQTGITNFVKIDEHPASGNTSVITEYGPVIDRNVQAGNKYAYRLKMLDFNGEFEYSDEKVVSLDAANSIQFGEVKPNPVRDFARFDVSAPQASEVAITLYDMTGKALLSVFEGTITGGDEISIDTRNLASGAYKVVLRSGNVMLTRTFNVVR